MWSVVMVDLDPSFPLPQPSHRLPASCHTAALAPAPSPLSLSTSNGDRRHFGARWILTMWTDSGQLTLGFTLPPLLPAFPFALLFSLFGGKDHLLLLILCVCFVSCNVCSYVLCCACAHVCMISLSLSLSHTAFFYTHSITRFISVDWNVVTVTWQ